MKDVQNEEDTRGITIQRVGVTNVEIPILVKDKSEGVQHSIGSFDISVELPANQKGTHMSRFLEHLEGLELPLSMNMLSMTILPEIKKRLDATSGTIAVTFPYFVKVTAPISKKESNLKLIVTFMVDDDNLYLKVITPVSTLCPCSKEISMYGAHNQRGEIEITVRPEGWLWIEDLFEIANASASCPIYPLLKREDEKAVTETAYENPRFVEDIVREAALLLEKHPNVSGYRVMSINYESIHSHDAFAIVHGGEEV